MTDKRMNLDLISDILHVLDRHGYARADDEHTGRAILLIGDLAHIYEGALDHPFGPYIDQPSSPQAAPDSPAPDDTMTVSAAEARTIMLALDEAADYKRDRAAGCADCTGQSCTTCQSRVRTAEAYDQLAGRMAAAAEASKAATVGQPEPHDAIRSQLHVTADREAGQ